MHAVINPATEETIATVPATSAEEVDEAIEAMTESPTVDLTLLRRFSDVVRDHAEELALLEVANAGHTIGNARWEANNVANVLNYYSGAPERLFGRQIPVAGGIDVTFKEPVGVVGVGRAAGTGGGLRHDRRGHLLVLHSRVFPELGGRRRDHGGDGRQPHADGDGR